MTTFLKLWRDTSMCFSQPFSPQFSRKMWFPVWQQEVFGAGVHMWWSRWLWRRQWWTRLWWVCEQQWPVTCMEYTVLILTASINVPACIQSGSSHVHSYVHWKPLWNKAYIQYHWDADTNVVTWIGCTYIMYVYMYVVFTCIYLAWSWASLVV